MGTKPLFVRYCASDFLGGTELMPPLDELAYRRICDLIYHTNDKLLDDDEALGHSTKTGARWIEIKARLLIAGKIKVVHGRITNDRCRKELGKVAGKIAQSTAAGRASAVARKALKENANSTVVGTDVATDDGTDGQPNHLTTEPLNRDSSESPTVVTLFGESENHPPPSRIEGEFEGWWSKVPRKVDKGHARKAFERARRKASLEQLSAGIEAYAARVAGKDPRYIAHPTTWLNGERWLDEAPPAAAAQPDGESAGERFSRSLARWKIVK